MPLPPQLSQEEPTQLRALLDDVMANQFDEALRIGVESSVLEKDISEARGLMQKRFKKN